MDTWNWLVQHHSTHLNSKEKVVQEMWESIFHEIFGYSKLNNEIEPHRYIRIGSTERVITDIIIRLNNSDIFVVEVKQHNMTKTKEMELQLFSYLKLLRLDIGVLICDKIYIYNYDYSIDDSSQNFVVIDFIKDSELGIQFATLMSKETFNKVSIKEFINTQSSKLNQMNLLKQELQDKNLIMSLIETYFVEKYNREIYKDVLDTMDVNIQISDKLKHFVDVNVNHKPQIMAQQSRVAKGNNEKIIMDILRDIMRKGFLTEDLLNKLQSIDYAKEMFKLRGNKYPILFLEKNFYTKYTQDERKRFYQSVFEHNGESYLVSSQWFWDGIELFQKWHSKIISNL